MVRLSNPDFSRLFDLTYNDDIFGLHALHDEEGGDPYQSGCLHDAVTDILTGEEPCDDIIRSYLAQNSSMLIDRLTAQMMRLNGLRPAAACALAIKIRNGIRIQDYHDQSFVAYVDELSTAGDPSGLTAVKLIDKVRWNQTGSVRIPCMPQTVLSQLENEPLTKLIEHPLLDPLKLKIENIYLSPGWPGDEVFLDVQTGYKADLISLEELMEI